LLFSKFSINLIIFFSDFLLNFCKKIFFKYSHVHKYIDICFQNPGIVIFVAFQLPLVKKISQGFDIFKYFLIFLSEIKPFFLVENFVFATTLPTFSDK